MKLSIILLIVGLCVVSAKYLPEEWDNSDQFLSRFKRFDLGDSDTSSENNDESDSKNDDSDNSTDETEVKEQSKHIASLERMRQKLLEKQEKERLKQEEAQRKIEEKIAKELQKEEEKRQKEQRKWEERLEKERKKLEEEQRKIQEKIAENERKRQEKIQKEMEELENKQAKQESNSGSSNDADLDDDSIELEDIWKIHIYSKYGITEENTNVEKKEALRKYMQEELGLNANSTQSERRQAVLLFIQSELQKVPNINILRSQFIDYINYVGVDKIRSKLEGDIEKLKNKTETLDNVNFTWVPIAKQNLAEQVSFLETIKQFLSNLLPNWFNGNTDKPQQGVPVTNADSVISPDFGILTQQSHADNPTNTLNNANSNVSPSNTGDNVPNSPVSDNNDASLSTSSSVVPESSLIDSEISKTSVVDVVNSINQLDTVSKPNSQEPPAAETNGVTITGNEDSVNKQVTSETGSDLELNSNSGTVKVTKSDTGITIESAQTVSTINSDVSVSDVNEKTAIATDKVSNVNNGNVEDINPGQSQSNTPVVGTSAGDNTNVAENTNKDVDAITKNTGSATEYSNSAVTDTAAAVTLESAISSSSIPSSDLSETSSSTSNNNNQNTDIASSIAKEPKSANIDATTVDAKNSIADVISESSPTVDNGIAVTGVSGSDVTETLLTLVASNYNTPLGNTLDVSSTTSEGSKNVNSDVKQNVTTNSTNISETEASDNTSISNGTQSQVITEAIEVITPVTIVNESSNVVNQEQSNSETSNTEQQLINEITTSVTEQAVAAETKQQDVSQASDLQTDSVTQEAPVNPPIPIEPGAIVVDVEQQ